MLIYNHNKELVGIDDETLHHLGYKTLAGFLEEYSDVAELFVKKPGYIHNFQNFPWIDFVLHAEAEDTKAIVQNGKKHFSCNISITPIYLSDAPDQEGYVVYFKHIKSLSGTMETFERPEPTSQADIPTDLSDNDFSLPLEHEEETEPTVLQEPDMFDIPETPPIDLPDLNADGSLAEPQSPEVFEPVSAPEKEEKPMLGDYINQEEKSYLDNLQTAKDYVYDPHIAAEELGLPVELIEEFIGDFIQQAHDFHDSLFDAALKEDFDEIHVLSHKLKGVAANLRIEDAFEVLSIINNSRDQVEIEANLKQFYRIIAKMEGKEMPDFQEMESEEQFDSPLDDHEDDLYDIGKLLDTSPETAESDNSELDKLIDMPKPEETTLAETTPESTADETVEPFDLDIIPKEDQHLVNEAKEDESFSQISGNIATDADLTANPETEPLHYDIKKAAAEIGLKEEFVRSLIDEFVSEAVAKKAELMEAIDTGDLNKIKAIAFEFKGLADNLRIEQVSHALTKLLRTEIPAAVKKEAEHVYGLLNQL